MRIQKSNYHYRYNFGMITDRITEEIENDPFGDVPSTIVRKNVCINDVVSTNKQLVDKRAFLVALKTGLPIDEVNSRILDGENPRDILTKIGIKLNSQKS